MKILIIQLARLGDILMTWPQVRALKRTYPDAEIDILVRPRFQAATKGLAEINKTILFPVEQIFEPLFDEPIQLEQSLEVLDQTITQLRAEKYNWIINSTFSPASSYLTHQLGNQDTKITGYSRTTDGYLTIHHDVAAYIYAQVGVDRDNRIHLSDLLTLMLDIQPETSDWKTIVETTSTVPADGYIVLHVGASKADKRFSPFKWRTFISHFQKQSPLSIVLIGSDDEIKDSSFISLGFDATKVVDKTGQIQFEELFPLIASAKLYLGCDSAPLHIASLVDTPSLNISLNAVNFWETGPRATGSRILYAETEADLASETVAREALSMLNNEPASESAICLKNGFPSYTAPANCRNKDWTWSFVYALYMGGPWPTIDSNTIRQGLKNLFDVNNLILEQYETIKKTRNVGVVAGIIERCEDVIESVGKLVPELTPLIRWYQTQKAQIGPGTPTEVFDATFKVQNDFISIIQYWLTIENRQEEEINESPQS